MKTTYVSVDGGVTAKDVPCTIPAKFVRVYDAAAQPIEILLVQLRQPDGTFAAEQPWKLGGEITMHRSDGILCRPAHYSSASLPASTEVYCKVRTFSGNVVTLRVIEHEESPKGNY